MACSILHQMLYFVINYPVFMGWGEGIDHLFAFVCCTLFFTVLITGYSQYTTSNLNLLNYRFRNCINISFEKNFSLQQI